MTNEEFQRLVLEKLDKLEAGQNKLEAGQNKLEAGQSNLEARQKEILIKLDAVIEQTADLTEFRYEVKSELADIKNNISRIEIATADNWSDIARLKSVR